MPDPPAHPVKRKPDPDPIDKSEANCKTKLPKLDSPPAAILEANGVEEPGSESQEVTDEVVDPKGKGVIAAVDKGKGKMVVEDEDDDDGDDSSTESSVDGTVGDEDDSDFVDDPLAEVDLDNILPSRTRRRVPPPPGAYLVTDQEGEDDEDDDDEDVEE
ncbi:hypothetical protein J5N97_021507 [Dioscorea zingiberensis]|uniref:Histone chaperone domain-containing protein n=1 Tax=Dioscorea zingiberensis TaxID=325984 RepID=A0A9D5HEP1_9LILI|nr:hypothetical protein J5N97_021507 [Dioscorea zingiberensis]